METLLNPAEAAVLVAQLRARVIVSMTACRASDRCSSCFDSTPAGGNVRLAPPRLLAGDWLRRKRNLLRLGLELQATVSLSHAGNETI